MIKIDFFNKFVNRQDRLAEAGEEIKFSSPFRTYDRKEISPAYGQVLNSKGEWNVVSLPFAQGSILKVIKLDLNSEHNDPRRTPVYIQYFYHVMFENREYRFSSVYGHCHPLFSRSDTLNWEDNFL